MRATIESKEVKTIDPASAALRLISEKHATVKNVEAKANVDANFIFSLQLILYPSFHRPIDGLKQNYDITKVDRPWVTRDGGNTYKERKIAPERGLYKNTRWPKATSTTPLPPDACIHLFICDDTYYVGLLFDIRKCLIKIDSDTGKPYHLYLNNAFTKRHLHVYRKPEHRDQFTPKLPVTLEEIHAEYERHIAAGTVRKHTEAYIPAPKEALNAVYALEGKTPSLAGRLNAYAKKLLVNHWLGQDLPVLIIRSYPEMKRSDFVPPRVYTERELICDLTSDMSTNAAARDFCCEILHGLSSAKDSTLWEQVLKEAATKKSLAPSFELYQALSKDDFSTALRLMSALSPSHQQKIKWIDWCLQKKGNVPKELRPLLHDLESKENNFGQILLDTANHQYFRVIHYLVETCPAKLTDKTQLGELYLLLKAYKQDGVAASVLRHQPDLCAELTTTTLKGTRVYDLALNDTEVYQRARREGCTLQEDKLLDAYSPAAIAELAKYFILNNKIAAFSCLWEKKKEVILAASSVFKTGKESGLYLFHLCKNRCASQIDAFIHGAPEGSMGFVDDEGNTAVHYCVGDEKCPDERLSKVLFATSRNRDGLFTENKMGQTPIEYLITRKKYEWIGKCLEDKAFQSKPRSRDEIAKIYHALIQKRNEIPMGIWDSLLYKFTNYLTKDMIFSLLTLKIEGLKAQKRPIKIDFSFLEALDATPRNKESQAIFMESIRIVLDESDSLEFVQGILDKLIHLRGIIDAKGADYAGRAWDSTLELILKAGARFATDPQFLTFLYQFENHSCLTPQLRLFVLNRQYDLAFALINSAQTAGMSSVKLPLDELDAKENRALHWIADSKVSHADLFEKLCIESKNLSVANALMDTPLKIAVREEKYDLVNILLRFKKRLSTEDIRDTLFFAFIHKKEQAILILRQHYKDNLLLLAVEANNIAAAIQLLSTSSPRYISELITTCQESYQDTYQWNLLTAVLLNEYASCMTDSSHIETFFQRQLAVREAEEKKDDFPPLDMRFIAKIAPGLRDESISKLIRAVNTPPDVISIVMQMTKEEKEIPPRLYVEAAQRILKLAEDNRANPKKISFLWLHDKTITNFMSKFNQSSLFSKSIWQKWYQLIEETHKIYQKQKAGT